MIKQLHPTLKACKCGFIGTRTQLYRHFDAMKPHYTTTLSYCLAHGESVLNIGDPRIAHAIKFITATRPAVQG